MDPFKFDPAGPDIIVDIVTNLPVMGWRSFGIWDAVGQRLDSSKRAPVNAIGQADYAVAPQAAFSRLGCFYEAIGPGSLIGEELILTLVVRQGAHTKTYVTDRFALQAIADGRLAAIEIDVGIPLEVA